MCLPKDLFWMKFLEHIFISMHRFCKKSYTGIHLPIDFDISYIVHLIKTLKVSRPLCSIFDACGETSKRKNNIYIFTYLHGVMHHWAIVIRIHPVHPWVWFERKKIYFKTSCLLYLFPHPIHSRSHLGRSWSPDRAEGGPVYIQK